MTETSRPHDKRAGIGASVLILGFLMCLPAATSQAADETPIPVEAFYRHPAIDRAELSPSGARVAVLTGVGASRISLAVFDLQNSASSKVVARFSDADIRDFRWVNDDYLVFSLIDLSAGGDQLIAPGLFSVKADGSGQRQPVNFCAASSRAAGLVASPLIGTTGCFPFPPAAAMTSSSGTSSSTPTRSGPRPPRSAST